MNPVLIQDINDLLDEIYDLASNNEQDLETIEDDPENSAANDMRLIQEKIDKIREIIGYEPEEDDQEIS